MNADVAVEVDATVAVAASKGTATQITTQNSRIPCVIAALKFAIQAT
ncbi:hypothetical protein [Pigmentiphaga litoralis]|uniref:Uncharacterized protein n=1 Tax=Pigmentiphaga litoralis TaxID=516702 RepID=A0A7Y9IY16_9BURK|nr:hypothetical protein [Pigmentiphaga litoralis]NYE25993.1 hypothetical protein [Pigmentiphaga litoralis]NYE85113.1 hypothetical protein [Pigmentiphaga litoralis]